MMKKNKSLKIILLCLLIVGLIGAIGATAAYMFKESNDVKNDFIPASVTCEAEEAFDGNEKSSIAVKNTGNIDAYMRVRLVSYWVNEGGNIVGKPSEMPSVDYDADLWVQDKENNTYYCTERIAPNGVTPQLLKSPIVLQTAEFNGKTVYQVVEVFAEAIQADSNQAMQDAWNKSFN